jgi:hypothetical protein
LRKLRHARLDFLYPRSHIQYIDQRMPMPELMDPSLCDPFSTSIRIFSQQLRTMYLSVVADATLFWPGDGRVLLVGRTSSTSTWDSTCLPLQDLGTSTNRPG